MRETRAERKIAVAARSDVRFYDLVSPSPGEFRRGAGPVQCSRFQSVVSVAIRPAQRARLSLAFSFAQASFTLVRRARETLSSVFPKDNVGTRAFMDVLSSLYEAAGRDVVGRRSLHVTRVNATLDEERDTRDHRCGRRDGQRSGGCEHQRRGLRLRFG